MTREDLSNVNDEPEHNALRDAFEKHFADPMDLAPEEYVVWLENLVLAYRTDLRRLHESEET